MGPAEFQWYRAPSQGTPDGAIRGGLVARYLFCVMLQHLRYGILGFRIEIQAGGNDFGEKVIAFPESHVQQ